MGKVFVAPLRLDIDEIYLKMTSAVETVDRNVLEGAWDETNYRLDNCRVSNGALVEHL
jgi:hypothetical protein